MANTLSPDDRKALKAVLTGIVASYTKIQGERESIRDTLKAAKDKFKIEPKTLNKVAVILFRQNKSDFDQDIAEIEDLYKLVSTA